MRRATLGRRFSCPGTTTTTTTSFFARAIPFSSSSGGGSGGGGSGRGRGRGHGATSSPFDFVRPSPPPNDTPKPSPPPPPSPSAPVIGRGRGSGIPRPPPSSSPPLPQFPSFGSAIGRGRPDSPHPQKQPVFFKRADPDTASENKREQESGSSIPKSIAAALSDGTGRGKPIKNIPGAAPVMGQEEQKREPELPRLSREEAVQRAMGILSRGEDGGGRGRREVVGGRGRGRGRGRGSGREVRAAFRERGRGRGRDESDDEDVGYAGALNAGDDKGGEILAERFGPEFMSKLAEGFEEMNDRVLPSPADDVYIDAFHTNCLVCAL